MSGEAARVRSALKRHGLLLLQDKELPSLAGLVAGEAIKGSWWGHPKSNQIWLISESLEDHPDVTVTRLVARKVTFVHRRLWDALFAVATSDAAWQREGLSHAARSLRTRLRRVGSLRTDRVKLVAASVKELEQRLLVHSRDVHTESGAHAKELCTWKHWCDDVGFKPTEMSAPEGRELLEQAVASLAGTEEVGRRLPW